MLKQTTFPDVFTTQMQVRESQETISKKVFALISEMTVPEKFSLLHGSNDRYKGKIANAGYLQGVPRLGIPEIRMYDGPAGVTSIKETTGLPCPLLLAATWDDEMAYLFGKVAGSENRAISGNMQLGAQLDTIRAPYYGRNRDMKGEDYYLSGRMGVQEFLGIQDQGVVGVAKHFVVANVQADGNSDVSIDEQTLHENYLRPFQWAVKAGGANAIMAAGHKVGGYFCNDNAYLLTNVLRDMWKYRGFVMSDWGGNHTMSLGKGTDMEMPFPTFHEDYRILRAISEGAVTWKDIDRAISGILHAMGTVGLLSLVELDDDGRPKEERERTFPIKISWEYDDAEKNGLLMRNAEIAEQIALEGVVLLKNTNNALPLTQQCYTGESATAVIGLGGMYAICGCGEERSFGRLSRMVSPLNALQNLTGGNFIGTVGADIIGQPIPAENLYRDAECSQNGVVRSYGICEDDVKKAPRIFTVGGNGEEFHGYNGELDDHGDLIINRMMEGFLGNTVAGPMGEQGIGTFAGIDPNIDFTCGTHLGALAQNYRNAKDGTAFHDGEKYTWNTYLCVPEDGDYILKLETIGGQAACKICIDGQWILVGESNLREGAHWAWSSVIPTPEGMDILSKRISLRSGEAYQITVYASHSDMEKDLQLRLAWITPEMLRIQEQKTIDVAQTADEIILFLNDFEDASTNAFEMFSNRESIALRPSQQKLFELVRKNKRANSKLITVVQSPAPNLIAEVAEQSDAVLVTFMPGQEGGYALAKLLLGEATPSGKLPITIPVRESDTPVSDTPDHLQQRMAGVDTKIDFSEGIFTGYRWYDKYGVAPLYPFGHGLSYTTFEYSDANAQLNDEGFLVTVKITNVGDAPGSETAQLYLNETDVPAHLQIAKQQLAAYCRTKVLQPGESEVVSMMVSWQMLSVWDPALGYYEKNGGKSEKWRLLSGIRKLNIGASSRDARIQLEIDVPHVPRKE